jgi:hypothetical protein
MSEVTPSAPRISVAPTLATNNRRELDGPELLARREERELEASTAADHRDDTADKDADYDNCDDTGSVNEHVADFELSARHQFLAKLQGHAQQYHGEGSRDGERPALAGQ